MMIQELRISYLSKTIQILDRPLVAFSKLPTLLSHSPMSQSATPKLFKYHPTDLGHRLLCTQGRYSVEEFAETTHNHFKIHLG